MSENLKEKETKKRIALLGSILTIAVLMWWVTMHYGIDLEMIKSQREAYSIAVRDHPVIAASVYVLLYAGAVTLSLPFATLLTLLGGFLFGRWLGTVLVVTGATAGAVLIFLIARSALGEPLREKAGPLYTKIETNMKENAAGYLLFMRLVPLFPFFLVNIVPALFNVRLRVYLWTTFFGIIPGSFIYVNLGSALGEIESLNDLVSAQTLAALAMLGLFALLPTLYQQIKKRKKHDDR